MKALSSLAFVVVVSITGCKKKAAPEPPPPATGSAAIDAAARADATAVDGATGSAGSGQTVADAGAAGSGSVEADCALYGEVAAKCGHGQGDAKAIANECLKALVKNTAMAPSIRIQINCAKADATCGVFDTCIAKP